MHISWNRFQRCLNSRWLTGICKLQNGTVMLLHSYRHWLITKLSSSAAPNSRLQFLQLQKRVCVTVKYAPSVWVRQKEQRSVLGLNEVKELLGCYWAHCVTSHPYSAVLIKIKGVLLLYQHRCGGGVYRNMGGKLRACVCALDIWCFFPLHP